MYITNNFLICVHIKVKTNCHEHNFVFLIMKGHREVYQMLLWHSYLIGLEE